MLTSTDYIKAERNGVKAGTLRSRIASGWDKETAISQPVETERHKWLEVARENGIKEFTFDNRIYNLGWSFKKAATTKVSERRSRKEWLELARRNGISEPTFNSRVYSKKWDRERAATEPLKNVSRKRQKQLMQYKRINVESPANGWF